MTAEITDLSYLFWLNKMFTYLITFFSKVYKTLQSIKYMCYANTSAIKKYENTKISLFPFQYTTRKFKSKLFYALVTILIA